MPDAASVCRCHIPDIDTAYRHSSIVVFANVRGFVIAPSGEGSTARLKTDH